MGMANRQRRAAKAKKRKAKQGRQERRYDFPPYGFGVESAVLTLRQLVMSQAQGYHSMLDSMLYQRHPEHERRCAVGQLLHELVAGALARGWSVADLHEAMQRKADAAVAGVLPPVVREESRRRGEVDPDEPAQHGDDLAHLPWQQAERPLIELLALLCTLPLAEPDFDGPDASGPTGSTVDERVLRKVRALLAKAEASMFEEEADACTAKAQQLMSEYAIERAWAETQHQQRRRPVSRRMWLDAPYVNAKSLLVAAVAASNHCASVLSSSWGFTTLIGYDSDVEVVELLSTSLLVQATRAIALARPQLTRAGASRTRSFRQSFLVAYADRIGERLRDAAAEVETAADVQRGGALLPVLAARDDAVRDALAAMFPYLMTKEVNVSNFEGWGAGRAAAELAQLDFRPLISDERAG